MQANCWQTLSFVILSSSVSRKLLSRDLDLYAVWEGARRQKSDERGLFASLSTKLENSKLDPLEREVAWGGMGRGNS